MSSGSDSDNKKEPKKRGRSRIFATEAEKNEYYRRGRQQSKLIKTFESMHRMDLDIIYEYLTKRLKDQAWLSENTTEEMKRLSSPKT